MKTLNPPKSIREKAGKEESTQMELRDPQHYCNHVVQFYDSDEFLMGTVAAFLKEALETGEAAIAIATPEHRRGIEERLSEQGIDIPKAKKNGRYVSLDAAETLSQFMSNGAPDKELFNNVVGHVIAKACSALRRVRAFGEMVALLCAEGKSDAAIQLEEIWNDL